MAKDLGDAIGTVLGRAAREAAQNVGSTARKQSKNGSLTGVKGFAAGAGLAALAPLAAKGAGKLAKGTKATVGKGVKAGVDKTVDKAVDKAGGAGGIAKEAGKSVIPGLGNGGGDKGGKGGKKNDMPGVGKGRRMPIQQAVDVAVPLKTAYNQWTQFEDWPKFMHRLDRVSQEDESHVSFKTKIWGISKEFKAEIVDQRPDERIKWKVTDGVTHTGVVSFHELSDRLTRIEVNLDVDPGSLIEKAGRGMRHVKRAVRADLARFKAYIEMEDEETGSWRGTIEDGDVKRQRSSSSSRRKSSSSRRSKPTSGRSSSSGARSKSASSRSKASSSRSKASSSRSKSSSNGRGSSSGGRSRTTAKARSSSNGRSGSGSSSSRKKSGSRS
jgi:uncharacterized membrane protein